MEYGHTIIDTGGGEHFFVEGCTSCSMTAGGQHEAHCPSFKKERVISPFTDGELNKLVAGQAIITDGYTFPGGERIYDTNLLSFYKKKGYI